MCRKAGAWESSSDVQGTEWFTLPPAQLRHALPLRAIDDAAFVAAPAAGEVWSEKGGRRSVVPREVWSKRIFRPQPDDTPKKKHNVYIISSCHMGCHSGFHRHYHWNHALRKLTSCLASFLTSFLPEFWHLFFHRSDHSSLSFFSDGYGGTATLTAKNPFYERQESRGNKFPALAIRGNLRSPLLPAFWVFLSLGFRSMVQHFNRKHIRTTISLSNTQY